MGTRVWRMGTRDWRMRTRHTEHTVIHTEQHSDTQSRHSLKRYLEPPHLPGCGIQDVRAHVFSLPGAGQIKQDGRHASVEEEPHFQQRSVPGLNTLEQLQNRSWMVANIKSGALTKFDD